MWGLSLALVEVRSRGEVVLSEHHQLECGTVAVALRDGYARMCLEYLFEDVRGVFLEALCMSRVAIKMTFQILQLHLTELVRLGFVCRLMCQLLILELRHFDFVPGS